MKLRIYLFILFIYILISPGCAQVTVMSVEKLPLPEAEKYFHPRIDETGTKILLTEENYKGLVLYDLVAKQLKQITDAEGAGYQPVIMPGGNKIVFVGQEFIQNRKYSSISAYDMATNRIDIVEPAVRTLAGPVVAGNRLLFKADGNLKSAGLSSTGAAVKESVAVGIEDRQLVLYSQGNTRILKPFEDESYIWPSVSPDNKLILAYAMGKGSFICDTAGTLLAQFPEIEAPVWAGNDFIAGMKTEDDGHQITASVVVLVKIDTGKEFTLSPAGMTAMYPSVCISREKIVFHTVDGKIMLAYYHTGR